MRTRSSALPIVIALLAAGCQGGVIPVEELPGPDSSALCTPPAPSDHQGISMVETCPGTFRMGAPRGEVGDYAEAGQHEVTLTQGFFIGVTEVTRAQFEEVMGYDPSPFDACADCPVSGLMWHEAAAFASALSWEAGLEDCFSCTGEGPSVSCSPTGPDPYGCEGFRLPTEAEWELAARAGSTTAFPNGGNLLRGDDNSSEAGLELDNSARLDDIAWYRSNSDDRTHPVASLEPNTWGLYDTSGNATEWCWDWYSFELEPATDPSGAESGLQRTLRGGSYWDFPSGVRTADREAGTPDEGIDRYGLRLVLGLAEE